LKDRPWAEVNEATISLDDELSALNDSLLSYALEHRMHTAYSRETRTFLRMVRMAVHYKATGDIQVLKNPEGGPIHSQKIGESLLIWNTMLFGQDDDQPPKDDSQNWKVLPLDRRAYSYVIASRTWIDAARRAGRMLATAPIMTAATKATPTVGQGMYRGSQ